MRKIWVILGRIAYVTAWPALYFYLKNSQRSRIIVQAEDHVLFVKDWLGDGSWKLPGGGIHKGEDITASACRELLEETGIVAKPTDLKTMGVTTNKSHGAAVTLHIYALTLDSIVEVKKQKLEIIDIAWLQPKDLVGLNKLSDTTLAVLQTAGTSFELDS